MENFEEQRALEEMRGTLVERRDELEREYNELLTAAETRLKDIFELEEMLRKLEPEEVETQAPDRHEITEDEKDKNSLYEKFMKFRQEYSTNANYMTAALFTTMSRDMGNQDTRQFFINLGINVGFAYLAAEAEKIYRWFYYRAGLTNDKSNATR
jgi:hypothetical protein